MMHLLKRLFLTLVITVGFSNIHAQQDQPPLDAQLLKNSEKWLIKIGMISGKKPPKLKFGEFSTVDRSGAAGEDFSMTMVNSANDSVFVKGINEKESGKNQNDISVYINTSIDTEELWILMMTRPPLSKKTPEERREISLESIIMTDGFSEITFETIMAEPKGDIEEIEGFDAMMDKMAEGMGASDPNMAKAMKDMIKNFMNSIDINLFFYHSKFY